MSQFVVDTATAAISFGRPQPWDIGQEAHYAFKLCETTLSVVPQRCRVALRTEAHLLTVPSLSSDGRCHGPRSRVHIGLVVHLWSFALVVWVVGV
jgi:hypothetical protein